MNLFLFLFKIKKAFGSFCTQRKSSTKRTKTHTVAFTGTFLRQFKILHQIQNLKHPQCYCSLTTMMATTKRGVREYHPFKEICNPKKKLDEGQDLSLCFKFVRKVCNETCRDRLTGKKYARTCHCLSILQKNAARQAAVAIHMANFIAKPQQERHSIIMEWQRYTLTTTRNELCFFIPFISKDGD